MGPIEPPFVTPGQPPIRGRPSFPGRPTPPGVPRTGRGASRYTAPVRIRLLSVGRDRSGLYAPAVDEYAKRISRYVKFAVEEVPEARKAAGTPRARDEEAASLLERIADGERVVLLDERGKEGTSLDFARRVASWVEGARDVTLVIGDPTGTATPSGRGPQRPSASPASRWPTGWRASCSSSSSTGPSPSSGGSRTTSEAAGRPAVLARSWHHAPPVRLKPRRPSPRLSLPSRARPPRRARSNCPR